MGILISLVVLVFSAIIHEIMHGYVADRLGDPTARLAGRLTLNPLKHIDPFMSILLPFLLLVTGSPILFGAAKPVPVDEFNLKEGRKDIALVALAGPLANIALAVVAALCLKLLSLDAFDNMPNVVITPLTVFFITVKTINILLAIFNLLPVPPLDGSKVFAMLLPEKEAAAYLSLGSFGFILVLILLSFPIGGFSLGGILSNLLSFFSHLLSF